MQVITKTPDIWYIAKRTVDGSSHKIGKWNSNTTCKYDHLDYLKLERYNTERFTMGHEGVDLVRRIWIARECVRNICYVLIVDTLDVTWGLCVRN